MSTNNVTAVSAFIEGAPPGELKEIVADIKALTNEDPSVLQSAQAAFQRYNEEQLVTVKLPGNSKDALVSSYNSLGNDTYYDVGSASSFAFDHHAQKAFSVQPHRVDSQHTDLMQRRESLLKSLSIHAREHFPSSTFTVCPTSSDSTLAILLVANKFSPSNFWNGRWRSTYLFDPSSSTLSGTIKVDVHYYEDGNVRLTTSKPVPDTPISGSATGSDLIKQVAQIEKKYQEELNKGFTALSEGSFKSLRRQLPVTRQKVEWEKVGGYRLGQDIGGGRHW